MRLSPDLPPDLKAGLDRFAYGMSRKALAERAAAQSRNYRMGGGSHRIATADDVLAYALTRLPATYAAAVAVFNAMHETLPTFWPRTQLDVGAGPERPLSRRFGDFKTSAAHHLCGTDGRRFLITLPPHHL